MNHWRPARANAVILIRQPAEKDLHFSLATGSEGWCPRHPAESAKMEKCWASAIGNCSDRLSREHTISKALLVSETVMVQGFPWCMDGPKEIGLSSLTSKCLCTRHNSLLSPVDAAGAHAFSTLKEMARLDNVRSKLKPRIWKVVSYSIDGPGLERWFFKTLINIAYPGVSAVGRQSKQAGRPAKELVEVAFGLRRFDGRAGLYTVAHVLQQIDSKDIGRIAPLIKSESSPIEACLFIFRGFRFLLYLEPEGPPEHLSGLNFAGEDLGSSQLIFHLAEIRQMGGKYLSHVAKFKWQ